MPHNRGVLTRVERTLGAAGVATLLAGVLSANAMPGSAKPAPAAAETRAVPSPVAVPSTAPVTKPLPKPSTPKKAAKSAALPATPPLSGCPIRKRPGGGTPRPLKPPVVAEAALPAPVPVLEKSKNLDVVRGKGLWVTTFGKTHVDADALVAQARATDVRSLWIRTGGSRQGYYGDQFLGRLVPAAHRAGIAVIAWDFPFLSDPAADARRAQQAFAAGIDAFSPDVETVAEGTRLTTRRLALYLSLVRRYAGARPVVATVPRPSDQRRTYPYATFAPYADVFAPMIYWSCFEPGAVTLQSLQRLEKLLPVAPVGQGYDMGPEGGRRGTPSRAETLRFLDVAKRGGALGASLYTVEEAGPAQLQALADFTWA
jgi:hypothetical protein